MLTSWYFGAGGDILGQKHAFLIKKKKKKSKKKGKKKKRKTVIILRSIKWLTLERALNKTCDSI